MNAADQTLIKCSEDITKAIDEIAEIGAFPVSCDSEDRLRRILRELLEKGFQIFSRLSESP
jgi:hypothetical protein